MNQPANHSRYMKEKGRTKEDMLRVWVALLGSSFLCATTSFLNLACPAWSWKDDNPLTAIFTFCFQHRDLNLQIWYGVSLVLDTAFWLHFHFILMPEFVCVVCVDGAMLAGGALAACCGGARRGQGFYHYFSCYCFYPLWLFGGGQSCVPMESMSGLGRVKEKQQPILLGPPTWINPTLALQCQSCISQTKWSRNQGMEIICWWSAIQRIKNLVLGRVNVYFNSRVGFLNCVYTFF
jgi:hypothetical protein